MTIQDLSIEYDAINSQNTFTNGDTINGRVVLQVSKETKIQSLVFVGKGKARVVWHEHHGNHPNQHHHQQRVYWADEKYYEVKHHILREARQDGTEVISKGRHVFPFSFKIPDQKMPSTFTHSIGKVVHKLRAELRQSMRFTKKSKVHFTFISRADMNAPGLMEPQSGFKDKSLLFGSGSVSVDVRTKRMGYKQGAPLKVTMEIVNQSSRDVKPKLVLYEKKSFFAQGRRKLQTNEILKEKVDAVASSSRETLTKVINIPKELPPSILNCSIIRLEYRLKIYLDIKYAADPTIKLPIVVLPKFSQEKHNPASAGFGVEAFGNSDPPVWSSGPQQSAAFQPMNPQPLYPQTLNPQPQNTIYSQPLYPLNPQPLYPQPMNPQPLYPLNPLNPQPLYPLNPLNPQPLYPQTLNPQSLDPLNPPPSYASVMSSSVPQSKQHSTEI